MANRPAKRTDPQQNPHLRRDAAPEVESARPPAPTITAAAGGGVGGSAMSTTISVDQYGQRCRSGSLHGRRKTREAANRFLRAIEAEMRGANLRRIRQLRRLKRRVERVARCGATACGFTCQQQICPGCAARDAKRRNREVLKKLKTLTAEQVAHITGTLIHPDPGEGLDELRRSLTRLRRRVAWARVVAGGACNIEIKYSKRGRRLWNVHFHAVVEIRDGTSPHEAELASAWKKILGGSGHPGSLTVVTGYGFR